MYHGVFGFRVASFTLDVPCTVSLLIITVVNCNSAGAIEES